MTKKCNHIFTRNVPSGNHVHWGKAICTDCGRFVTWLPMNTHFSEILNVPFEEKDAAKRAGARWDKFMRVWYSPSPANISLLEQWRVPGNEPKPPVINPLAKVGVSDEDFFSGKYLTDI